MANLSECVQTLHVTTLTSPLSSPNSVMEHGIAGSRPNPEKKALMSGKAIWAAPSAEVHTSVRVSGCPKHLGNAPSSLDDVFAPFSKRRDYSLSSHSGHCDPRSAPPPKSEAGKRSEYTRDSSKPGMLCWWQQG